MQGTNYFPVTFDQDRQVASDAYDPTVQVAQMGSKSSLTGRVVS